MERPWRASFNGLAGHASEARMLMEAEALGGRVEEARRAIVRESYAIGGSGACASGALV